jgi:hypothetical protein
MSKVSSVEENSDVSHLGNFTLAIIPIFGLGMVQLLFVFYAGLMGALASFGLVKPLRPINQPKMMIEAMAMKESGGLTDMKPSKGNNSASSQQ